MAEFVQTKIIKIHIQIICLIFCIQHLFAQSNQWPAMFIAPDSSQVQEDSSRFNVSNDFSYFSNYKQLSNDFHLDYTKSSENITFSQMYGHSLQLYSDSISNQYIDLTGNVQWGNLHFLNSDLGFTYEPKISYKRRKEESTLRSNIYAGPFIRIRPFKIPVKIQTGVSAASNDKLPGGISSKPLSSYHGDPGVYGGCEIGDSTKGIAGLPLFVNMKLFGKTIEGEGSGLIMGNLLFQHQILTGDSFYVYGADTLFNGKDIEFLYEDAPWRINHSFQGAAGLKVKERRLGIVPAVFYSYRLSTTEYPSSDNLIDIKKSSHTVNAQLTTTDRYFFDYQGGLELTWDYEDRYFRDRSHEKNNNKDFHDHWSDLASSDHLLRINLPANIAVEYELHAFKDSKKYIDTLNDKESDCIRTRHHWGIRVDSIANAICSEIYGEYAKTYMYYFRKTNSKESRIDEDFRVGLNASFSRNRLRLEEKTYVNAGLTDYKFKSSSKLPPYTRRVSSTLNTSWVLTKNVELSSSLIHMYDDCGDWYGKDYFDSTEADFRSYYAINSKTSDYAVLFYTKLLFKSWTINAGASYRDIVQRNYNIKTDSYLKKEYAMIEPTLKFNLQLGFLSAQGKIGHIIYSRNSDPAMADNKWDLLFKINATF